jgi:hypothetical protein
MKLEGVASRFRNALLYSARAHRDLILSLILLYTDYKGNTILILDYEFSISRDYHVTMRARDTETETTAGATPKMLYM